jgi:hypothetical protein
MSDTCIEENLLDEKDDIEIQGDIDENEVYPATINVSKDDSSVYELKRQYDKDRIELSPDYQRGNVWNSKQRSELIESILMGIPLPIMYFFQNSSGIKQVVDGKQRLTALFDYINNKFSLSDLNIMSELKGKKFKDLTGLQQGKIEDYKVSINVIKPPTPDRIKFDIFDRVNRGGTRLNNQEMRNAIYQGEATKLLERLKDYKYFKKATDNSIRSKVMKDRYMILRFIAFYLWRRKMLTTKSGELVEYKSDIDAFLGKTMDFLNHASPDTIMTIENIFKATMKNSYDLLGSNGFRISTYKKSSQKRPVNMALFESLAYLLSFNKVREKKEVVKKKIKSLFDDVEFDEAITTPVDSSSKVNIRFQKMDEIIRSLDL